MRVSDRDLLALWTAAIGFGLSATISLHLAFPSRVPLWVLLSLVVSLWAIPAAVTWLAHRSDPPYRAGRRGAEASRRATLRWAETWRPREAVGVTVLLLGTLVFLRAYTELAEDPLARAVPVPGVVVEARHAHTGQPVAHDVLAVLRDGDYTETLSVVSDAAGVPGKATTPRAALLAGAYERPGIYRIRLTRPGFRAWRARGIVVERREGRLVTARLLAELEPEAGSGDPGSTKSGDPLEESARRPRLLRRRRPRPRA